MNNEFDVLHESLLIDEPLASQVIVDQLSSGGSSREAVSRFLKTRKESKQMSQVLLKISCLDEIIDGVRDDNGHETINGSVFVGGVLACMVMDEVSRLDQYPRPEYYARWLWNEGGALEKTGYGLTTGPRGQARHQKAREVLREEGLNDFTHLSKHLQDVVACYYIHTDKYDDLESIKIGYGRMLTHLSAAYEECYSDTIDVESEKFFAE